MDHEDIREGVKVGLQEALHQLRDEGLLPFNRPFHEVFVPMIERSEEGHWRAFTTLGDVGEIRGVGATPAEAIENFNKAFGEKDGVCTHLK